MATKLVELNQPHALAKWQFSGFDDFYWYVTAHLWTSVLTDTGTIAVGDTHGGVALLTPSDGSVADNDEAYLKSTAEIIKLDADNTVRVAARIQFTEANTDDANVMFGVMNAVAANSIVDDGGGPQASFSGAVFYKVDGETYWRVRSSIGTTNTTTALTAHTAGGSSYQVLEIEFKPVSLTRVQVTFFIDGRQVLDPAAGYPKPLEHYLDATSATEMNVFVGVKNGGANLETVNVDWIAWDVTR